MRPKICYIDDEALLLELFSDIFTDLGADILTFVDPDEAVECLKENPPDLLFIDHRLGSTTGEQIVSQLKPSYPVALITGELDPPKVPPEITAILQKPFNEDSIRDFIQKHLGTRLQKNAA